MTCYIATMLHCHIVVLPCPQELFEPLHLMYTSLLSTGDESTANHKLLDTLRQVGTGWQLLKLQKCSKGFELDGGS